MVAVTRHKQCDDGGDNSDNMIKVVAAICCDRGGRGWWRCW